MRTLRVMFQCNAKGLNSLCHALMHSFFLTWIRCDELMSVTTVTLKMTLGVEPVTTSLTLKILQVTSNFPFPPLFYTTCHPKLLQNGHQLTQCKCPCSLLLSAILFGSTCLLLKLVRNDHQLFLFRKKL